MTADIVNLFPTGADADDVVRHTIKALLKGKGVKVEEIAPHVGVSASTLYRKLAGKGSEKAFEAGEVASIARYLGVQVGQLYDGLGGTFVPTPPEGGEPLRGTHRYLLTVVEDAA